MIFMHSYLVNLLVGGVIGWYPGQPELEDGPETAPEPLARDGSAAPSYRVAGSVGAGASINPVSVPSVLKKLQKWGDYESVGAQVLPTKFIPMKVGAAGHAASQHRLTFHFGVVQTRARRRPEQSREQGCGGCHSSGDVVQEEEHGWRQPQWLSSGDRGRRDS